MGSSPEPKLIEERFDELFEAARMLLREGVSEEERIVPTLAFANNVRVMWPLTAEKERLLAAWGDPEAWEREAEMFAWRHTRLRPIEIVDGIPVLEQLPVYVYIHNPVYVGAWDAEPTEDEHARALWDMEVVVAVYPHPRPASRELVADLYERTLSAAGVSCEESRKSRMGSMRVEYREDHLLLIFEHGDKTVPVGPRAARYRKPVFPHPGRVADHYELLMGRPSGGGFASDLATRKRGRAPEPENLISACVAFYLRAYTRGREQIHKLLNDNVLRETWKTLPEGGYSCSETNQLWRDVDKVENRLLAAAYPLYFSEPEWMTSHNSFLPKKVF
jgi:hypothetical protein